MTTHAKLVEYWGCHLGSLTAKNTTPWCLENHRALGAKIQGRAGRVATRLQHIDAKHLRDVMNLTPSWGAVKEVWLAVGNRYQKD